MMKITNTNTGIEIDAEEAKRKAAQKPETREQRRYRERINQEAADVMKTLKDRFTDFFVTCENPEGEEVQEKIKQISAQWRTHCKRRNLIPAAYPVMDEYMDSVLKEYVDQKNLKESQEK
jgi:uncharacterized protein (DUF849 family)